MKNLSLLSQKGIITKQNWLRRCNEGERRFNLGVSESECRTKEPDLGYKVRKMRISTSRLIACKWQGDYLLFSYILRDENLHLSNGGLAVLWIKWETHHHHHSQSDGCINKFVCAELLLVLLLLFQFNGEISSRNVCVSSFINENARFSSMLHSVPTVESINEWIMWNSVGKQQQEIQTVYMQFSLYIYP